jgi:group I intron endonuclease
MENLFNFVYITTNLINRKQYIGDHSTNDTNDNYLGSGRPYFQRALKEYGKQNFKREILEFFPNKQEAFDAQEKYIIKYNTLSPNGYNISPKGGHNVKDCWSEESKQKCAKTQTGKSHSEETKRKISLNTHRNFRKKGHVSPLKGKHFMSDKAKEKISIARKGKEKSKEHREKIQRSVRESWKDTHIEKFMWVCNFTKNKYINIKEKEKYLNLGYIIGRKVKFN